MAKLDETYTEKDTTIPRRLVRQGGSRKNPEQLEPPKNVHSKTDSEIEQLVVNVRKSLFEGATEDTKYRCIEAVEIQFSLHDLGYSEDETPSLSTIKRIIKRNGLISRLFLCFFG